MPSDDKSSGHDRQCAGQQLHKQRSHEISLVAGPAREHLRHLLGEGIECEAEEQQQGSSDNKARPGYRQTEHATEQSCGHDVEVEAGRRNDPQRWQLRGQEGNDNESDRRRNDCHQDCPIGTEMGDDIRIERQADQHGPGK